MKSNQEIINCVETARQILRKIYMDDPRINNLDDLGSDSGVSHETKLVFQETLRHLLDN